MGGLLDIPMDRNFNSSWNNRRRLIEIKNFAKHKQLKSVALISWDFGSGFRSSCSGSYVKNPKGVTGKYVATAGHCLYDKRKTGGHDWKAAIDKCRVEFGVTGEAAAGTTGIITCKCADIRVHDEWVNVEYNDRLRHDIAIIKLEGCTPKNPSNPFVMGWTKVTGKTLLDRAGYRGTRTLKVEDHVKIKGKEIDNKKRMRKHKLIVTKGISGGGDSGGPKYVEATNKQVAIHTGVWDTGQKRAVKLTKSNVKSLGEFMKKIDGVSPLIKPCRDKKYKSHECWSGCVSKKPKPCFTSATQTRIRADGRRKVQCGGTGSGKYKYVCGPIKKCGVTASKKQRCSTKCFPGKTLRDTKAKCPSDRTARVAVRCVKKQGWRYICSKKTTSSAYEQLYDYLFNVFERDGGYEEYESDMDYDNIYDDNYYDFMDDLYYDEEDF
eukprot:509349_1